MENCFDIKIDLNSFSSGQRFRWSYKRKNKNIQRPRANASLRNVSVSGFEWKYYVANKNHIFRSEISAFYSIRDGCIILMPFLFICHSAERQWHIIRLNSCEKSQKQNKRKENSKQMNGDDRQKWGTMKTIVTKREKWVEIYEFRYCQGFVMSNEINVAHFLEKFTNWKCPRDVFGVHLPFDIYWNKWHTMASTNKIK